MKIELGGGVRPRGDGWVNVDLVASADIRHDLDVTPWPLGDASVSEVYSSHCLEHLRDPFAVLGEICRVCVLGAAVEIRVPHPISDLAMTSGHTHVFSPIQALNMDHYFPQDFWRGAKRMKLERIEYHSSVLLDEAKRELPFLRGLSDDVIMRWIPRTCHECRFFYVVAANDVA